MAQHDDATKAAVVAALVAGQGVLEVARAYHLPKQTVSTWKREAKGYSIAELQEKTGTPFDELLAAYLTETLITLAVQQKHFRDVEWLKKQPAHELAVLHGVSADKAIRILEAAEIARGSDAG